MREKAARDNAKVVSLSNWKDGVAFAHMGKTRGTGSERSIRSAVRGVLSSRSLLVVLSSRQLDMREWSVGKD